MEYQPGTRSGNFAIDVVWSVVGMDVIARGVPSGPLTVHCQSGSVGAEEPQAIVPFTVRLEVSPGSRLRKSGRSAGAMLTAQGTEASGAGRVEPP